MYARKGAHVELFIDFQAIASIRGIVGLEISFTRMANAPGVSIEHSRMSIKFPWGENKRACVHCNHAEVNRPNDCVCQIKAMI